MRYRAVIVENEEHSLSRLQRLLQGFPNDVEIVGTAADGPNAVQVIRALRPDLVFLDIDLPGFNGFQVLEQLYPAPAEPVTSASGYPVNVYLTASGYEALGAEAPENAAFRAGMLARGDTLNDPPVEQWAEKQGGPRDWKQVHALIVLGYDPIVEAEKPELFKRQQQIVEAFKQILHKHADFLFEELGEAIEVSTPLDIPQDFKAEKIDPKGVKLNYRIEHFGFRDGVSQPVFYQSSMDRYVKHRAATTDRWTSFAALSLALTPDPHGRTEFACGSYIVFRKLEQDVERFCSQTAKLAEKLRLSPEALRAKLIGRLRNGRPLVAPETWDDFDYSEDPNGERCPYYAHARKTNPRSDVRASYGPRERRIVRRGITYGEKIDRDEFGAPRDGKALKDGKPVGPLGLLFVCAQRDIEQQFEHLQGQWANRPDHPRGRPSGADALIGQSSGDDAQRATFRDFDYSSAVTLRGGGYFFAPSISFLRGLLDDLLS